MNKIKELTTSIENFEPSRLTMTDFQDNKYTKGQKTAYLRYKHPSLGEDTSLMLQTSWITLSSGGIPKENPEYHKTDRDRAYLRIPVEEGSEMFEKLCKLDEQFTSAEFKNEKFGKSGKKYSMYPIVKIHEPDEDDDRDPLPPSMKIKFDLEWNEDDRDACVIRTQVFKSEEEDGKRIRTKTEAKSIQDMEKLIRLGCRMRLIIRPVKGWMNAKKEYGIIWKVMKMEVEPSNTGNALMKAFYEADAFLDSDDDEEVELPTKKDTKKVAAAADDSDEDDSEEEDEEDEDEDEDEEEDDEDSDDADSSPVPVKRRSKGKSKNL